MPFRRAKKRFDQNFLESPTTIGKIVDLVGPGRDYPIVEIGPGRGALTIPMAESGATILAVEIDRDLIANLRAATNDFSEVTIIETDFLRFDPNQHGLSRFILVGNLPYSLTSPVIDWCLSHRRQIERAVFMVQREFGARLAATEGSRDYAPISIFTRIFFDVQHCFDVDPTEFDPPPKVMSTVIKLTPAEEFEVEFPQQFEKLVRASFRQRRKLLANNLSSVLAIETPAFKEILQQIGFGEKCRAEELSIPSFLKLTDYLVRNKLM